MAVHMAPPSIEISTWPRRTLPRAMKALLFLALLAASAMAAASARDADPETLIRTMTQQLIDAAKSNPEIAAGGPKAVNLVADKVFPLIDFEEATRLALGRAWWKASKDQQALLIAEFRTLLVRTASAGQRYEGQTIRVLPVRMKPGDTDVTVHNQYIRAGGKPIRLDYQMHKTHEGWKIYDIVVEGVSLVLAYRAEFEQVLRDQGIDGLIRRLAEKNRHAAQA